VEAAEDGDVIQIASGVYTEQVQILFSKITLIGQPGTILRATEQMTPFIGGPGSRRVPIVGILSSEVTIRGLTFEGERLAERFTGIEDGLFIQESSATVENCAFYGFRESTSGSHDCGCIEAVNYENPNEVNIRLVGNNFADSYDPIFVVGSESRKNVNITIE